MINDLKWLRNNKRLQNLNYSIFCLHNFMFFMFFIFTIVFGQTRYGTTVVRLLWVAVSTSRAHVNFHNKNELI